MVTNGLFFLISLLIAPINVAYVTLFVERASPVKIICLSYYLTRFAIVGPSSVFLKLTGFVIISTNPVFLNNLPATGGVSD